MVSVCFIVFATPADSLALADELKGYDAHRLWVKIDSAREAYQRELGAHIDQSKFLHFRNSYVNHSRTCG